MSNEQQNASFLEEHAGEGYGNIKGDAYATPLVKLLQPTSGEVGEGTPAGHFFNCATQKSIGDKVRCIPLDFEILWYEWEGDMGGLKGKYLPGSVPFVGDAYNRRHAETGRALQDTWCYYVLPFKADGTLEEDPVILSLPASSIKYLKAWNSMITSVKLASGKQAPYYSSVWQVGPTEKTKNTKGTFYVLGKDNIPTVYRERFIKQDELPIVQRALEKAHNVMMSYQNTGLTVLPRSPQAMAADAQF